MVARVLFPVLTYRENASTPPPPGYHQGPPFPASSTLAPTDYPASCLASRLRLMLIGVWCQAPWPTPRATSSTYAGPTRLHDHSPLPRQSSRLACPLQTALPARAHRRREG